MDEEIENSENQSPDKDFDNQDSLSIDPNSTTKHIMGSFRLNASSTLKGKMNY